MPELPVYIVSDRYERGVVWGHQPPVMRVMSLSWGAIAWLLDVGRGRCSARRVVAGYK